MTKPYSNPSNHQRVKHRASSNGSYRPAPSYAPTSKDSVSEPPSAKPPSIFHNFKGDVRAQDIFIEQIEAHRRKGEKHRVLFPGSDDFEMERMDVWNHDSICTPCLILQPKTTKEVASCIRGFTSGVRRCLVQNRVMGSNLLGIPRLCVAGGRNSVASMKDGAIVLDLSRMRGVVVDRESSTATVQGGARIIDLDTETGRNGLMCVAGVCQNVGVVGCILGGGVGYASRKHGLMADNVLSAEIVLSDGTVKRCSPNRRPDLYWSLCGGGGGVGVVTAVSLRCYPIQNAALLTFNLYAPTMRIRRTVTKQWGMWINGSTDDTDNTDESATLGNGTAGAPKEVYSQLILPSNSSSIHCIATSVDPEVIPQSEDRLEQYQDMMKKKSRRGSSFLGNSRSKEIDQRLPTCWGRVPGLAELRSDKFGSPVRSNSKFRMVRYFDELQGLSNNYMKAGNVFIACKYAKALSHRIIEVLVEATAGKKSPNNESRIFISSSGGIINEVPTECIAFDSRDMNFVIFIEGKWCDTASQSRDEKERDKVVKWVHWVANQLHFCDGMQSTAHPESSRDQVSKSGRSDPPVGWYNFGEENGMRLAEIKKKRDPRNVFSLSSRVSWRGFDGRKGGHKPNQSLPLSTISETDPDTARKDGVIDADDCLSISSKKLASSMKMDSYSGRDSAESPKRVSRESSASSCSLEDSFEDRLSQSAAEEDVDNAGGSIHAISTKETESESEEDLEEWSLAPINATNEDESENVVQTIAVVSDSSEDEMPEV